MRLTPQERDRLLIASAAALAQRRRSRGLRLNIPEASAVVADSAIEAARDGARLAEAVQAARSVLGPDDVLPGVAAALGVVRVEAVFDDGTRLVVVDDPIGQTPSGAVVQGFPGEVVPADTPVPAGFAETDCCRVSVENTSDVPISVTSHWHFFEANPRLRFDRATAYGRRLALPAGDSVRFDPHTATEVDLVPFGGQRVLVGFAGLVDGALDEPGTRDEAMRRVRALGYLDSSEPDTGTNP